MTNRVGTGPLSFGMLLAFGVSLMGCPDVPFTPDLPRFDISDASSDTDAFVPLNLLRIVESAGMPEGGERISLFGEGFTEGAKVFFGDAPGTTVLVMDSGQINCNVPAGEPGLVNVKVVLLDGQEAQIEDGYLYRGPMKLLDIDPKVGPSHQPTPVTVTGEGFHSGVRVLVGGRFLEDVKRVDDTTITGTVPARLDGWDGDVSVILSDGFEQRTLPAAYRFEDALRVLWLSPQTGSFEGGTTVTIYGSGLSKGTQVSFGGVAAETLVEATGYTITVRTPPGTHGPAAVEIKTDLQTEVLADAFAYADEEALDEPLTLLGLWPPTGAALGGKRVALAVYGLPQFASAQDLSVTFNGVAAQIVEVNAYSNQIVVTTPPGSLGSAEVVVKSGDNESRRSDLFSYGPTVSLATVSPSVGPPEGGQTVLLQGEGIAGAEQVIFGMREAVLDGVTDEGALKVITPPASCGKVDVWIVRDGQKTLLPGAYGYATDKEPRIWAISTTDGAQAGGRVLRLFGEGLLEFSGDLMMGDKPVDDVSAVDDATLTFRSLKGDVGTVNIKTSNAGTLAMSYSLFDPTSLYGGTLGGTIPEALNVTVLEMSSRDPIEGAFVILWDDIGTPYQGVTDERGQITFSDPGFGPFQMVTAAKDNHTTSSVVEFDARNVTLFLYSFEPSPPGPPGPGEPQPVPDGGVKGHVSGLEKYIIVPPGECHEAPQGALCAVCEEDADCEGEEDRCTDLGEQGKRCTSACQSDADCPDNFVCVGVGFGHIQCLPKPGKRTAICTLTQSNIFAYETSPTPEGEEEEAPETPLGPGVYIDSEGNYEMETPPGERAIVCFGGYLKERPEGDEFVPLRMGVRRHVFVTPGMTVDKQDVTLDIPLSRNIHFRLDGSPMRTNTAPIRQLDVFIEFGPDGVFRMPSRGLSQDGANSFELPYFPSKFEDSLYDATYTILARAYPEKTALGESNDASFVLLQELSALNEDTVFRVSPLGVERFQNGLVFDLHGVAGAGGERLWAVSDDGHVIAYDGTWWGLQQTPVSTTLRSVWAAHDTYIVAVGDAGAVLISDGLTWSQLAMPPELEAANWEVVHGVGADLWLAGDKGLWKYDGENFTPLLEDDFGRPQRVRAIWSPGPDSAWIAGDDGLLRRWTKAGFESYDRPGGDFFGIGGTMSSDMWVVGEAGRIVHFDGSLFFEYLPKTPDTLRAVQASDSNVAWAVGDNGTILKWNGDGWEAQPKVEHVDLTGVGVTAAGQVLPVGKRVVIVGPFLAIPKAVNPNALGAFMGSPLSFGLDPGQDASVTVAGLTESSGFPFWQMFVRGIRRHLPLPDLTAAWGLTPIWPGQGFLRLTRIYSPDMTLDRFDYTMLSQYDWRSWSVADFPVVW